MLPSFNAGSDLKVAIVSDSMVQAGGAERVVEALADTYADAPIFSVLYDEKRGPRSLKNRVVQSWLSKIPAARRLANALVPFYPSAIEAFDLSAYDVIISSHHTVAKGLLRNSDQVHVCYCHTPMRSLWERPHDELLRVSPLLRPFAQETLFLLRAWDYAAASRVDRFIANSRKTAERIAKHYRRESTVIEPPIDLERFRPGESVQDFYLVASRNVPYKRIDLAIAAFQELKRKLIIVGDGTDKLAFGSPYITFYGKVNDAKLVSLMGQARALIVPQYEDFGMAVLEMNACGRPVIAYRRGGAVETVVDGQTGIFFEEQSVSALVRAVLRFEQMSFDTAAIRAHAERFSKGRFQERIRAVVDETIYRERRQAFDLGLPLEVAAV